MSSLVKFQLILSLKAFITFFTFIRFVFCMNTLMSLHCMGSDEEFPAGITTIRFLSSMYSFMSHNKWGPHEEFRTETTVQSPWFLDIGTGRLERICNKTKVELLQCMQMVWTHQFSLKQIVLRVSVTISRLLGLKRLVTTSKKSADNWLSPAKSLLTTSCIFSNTHCIPYYTHLGTKWDT